MSVTELFLLAMIGIFTIPYLIWKGGRTDYYAPFVTIQIVTGILLGPGIFGHFFPDIYSSIFKAPVITALNGIAWWGVIVFVFLAGIELNLKAVTKNKKETLLVNGLAIGAPLLFGSLGAATLLMFPGFIGPKGHPWQFVIGIGMASAVTALPILVLFMEKLNILRQPIGQRILRYASLGDIFLWSILAVILLDWDRLSHQVIFLISYTTLAFGMRKFIPRLDSKDRLYVSFIWLALCSWAADWAGMHFMVGGFLAGAVLDMEWYGEAEIDTARYYVLMLMMPVFFLSTGLRTNWEMGGLSVVLAAILLFIAQLFGKLLGLRLAGNILKWQPGESELIGWLLQTKALIEIIFVNILLDKGIITSEMFTAMLLMAVASTMITIPVVAPKLAKLKELILKN